MSKYNPLSKRLAGHGADEWRTSFSELESVLGFPLPKAARTGRAWWAKNHSRAWTGEGWELGDVDHAGEQVVFRRGATPGAPAGGEARSEVQPAVMREASEAASARMHANRALGAAAMVTAGVAVVAGVGALLVRGVLRRR